MIWSSSSIVAIGAYCWPESCFLFLYHSSLFLDLFFYFCSFSFFLNFIISRADKPPERDVIPSWDVVSYTSHISDLILYKLIASDFRFFSFIFLFVIAACTWFNTETILSTLKFYRSKIVIIFSTLQLTSLLILALITGVRACNIFFCSSASISDFSPFFLFKNASKSLNLNYFFRKYRLYFNNLFTPQMNSFRPSNFVSSNKAPTLGDLRLI